MRVSQIPKSATLNTVQAYANGITSAAYGVNVSRHRVMQGTQMMHTNQTNQTNSAVVAVMQQVYWDSKQQAVIPKAVKLRRVCIRASCTILKIMNVYQFALQVHTKMKPVQCVGIQRPRSVNATVRKDICRGKKNPAEWRDFFIKVQRAKFKVQLMLI